MLTNLQKTPFVYFGGKSDAAPAVWAALGDVAHYVEPFMGSLAVLLRRPHPCNRPYVSETVNDIDGFLVNAFRAIQLSPDATAEAASYPVSEIDLTARHLALVRWRESHDVEHLLGDPFWHDPVMAGWWIWGISCWIGGDWCSGTGPWTADADGRLYRQDRGPSQTREPGVSRQLPFVGHDGQGVNRPGTHEPGVSRKRPHMSSNGQGVNRPGTREPGVSRKIPGVNNNGHGVHHAGTREPGVFRQRPQMGNNGHGVHHAGTREPGVFRQLPHMRSNGQGMNHANTREPGVGDTPDFHPMTMPEVRRWFQFLTARLRHVRILCGDWRRTVTLSVLQTLPVLLRDGICGIFVDPPYGATAVRDPSLYAHDSLTVASDVQQWCLTQGNDPHYRIVLAGFSGEHDILAAHGWREVEWFRVGYLKGGMNMDKAAQKRERLWLSPHTLRPTDDAQGALFDTSRSD